jgi:tyrosinase
MEFDRRMLLQTGAGLATIFALGGCEPILKAIRDRPQRRDFATLASNDPIVETYRDAVQAMKALPLSDPRNWTRQAQIHQDFCPHRNWFFYPWHRAYLLSFERICQELTGNKDFGLPYWNWSCNRKIPTPFWSGALNHSPRSATPASEANASVVGDAVIQNYLNETDFEVFAGGKVPDLRGSAGFAGLIEGGPHNYIHGFVNGTMATFMSPEDPVFWPHHNIIDYFWFEWNKRGNANTNDPMYTNFNIQGHMVDGMGDPVTYNVAGLILAPLLAYKFVPPNPCGLLRFERLEHEWLLDFLKQGAAMPFEPVHSFEPIEGVNVVFGDVERVQIPLPRDNVGAVTGPASKERLLLRLNDIDPPANEDFFVQVYVGLGEGEDASMESAAYAGSFAFFTDPSSDHMTHNYIVDLDHALQRQLAAGRVGAEGSLDVTLVAVAIEEGRKVTDRTAIIGSLQAITIPRRGRPSVDAAGIRINDERVKIKGTR